MQLCSARAPSRIFSVWRVICVPDVRECYSGNSARAAVAFGGSSVLPPAAAELCCLRWAWCGRPGRRCRTPSLTTSSIAIHRADFAANVAANCASSFCFAPNAWLGPHRCIYLCWVLRLLEVEIGLSKRKSATRNKQKKEEKEKKTEGRGKRRDEIKKNI